MPNNSWRDYFRPIIAETIGCFSPGDDERLIKKAAMASFPDDLRPRKYWPYKVWCSEVRRQLALRARREMSNQKSLDDLPLFHV